MNVITPPSKHECEMGYSHIHEAGTLAQCDICGQWWRVHLLLYTGIGPEKVWRKVRWYHLRSMHRINAWRENQR